MDFERFQIKKKKCLEVLRTNDMTIDGERLE